MQSTIIFFAFLGVASAGNYIIAPFFECNVDGELSIPHVNSKYVYRCNWNGYSYERQIFGCDAGPVLLKNGETFDEKLPNSPNYAALMKCDIANGGLPIYNPTACVFYPNGHRIIAQIGESLNIGSSVCWCQAVNFLGTRGQLRAVCRPELQNIIKTTAAQISTTTQSTKTTTQ